MWLCILKRNKRSIAKTNMENLSSAVWGVLLGSRQWPQELNCGLQSRILTREVGQRAAPEAAFGLLATLLRLESECAPGTQGSVGDHARSTEHRQVAGLRRRGWGTVAACSVHCPCCLSSSQLVGCYGVRSSSSGGVWRAQDRQAAAAERTRGGAKGRGGGRIRGQGTGSGEQATRE